MVRQAKEVRAEMTQHPVPQFELRHRMELALEYGNVSVAEIASELGVSRTTISNYLHGRTPARRSDLVVWALRCGVPFEWLLTGTVESVEATETPKRRVRKP